MKIDKEQTIGKIKYKLSIDVNLTLWSAIKMRIAGIYNIIKKDDQFSQIFGHCGDGGGHCGNIIAKKKK